MTQPSEEQIINRLLELENSEDVDRRAELLGERYLSLIHDPASNRSYILQHGTDDTEGAEVPPGTEFWEYADQAEAERAYEQLLGEARRSGDLVEDDSLEGIGDAETAGAEMRDRYSALDEDPLVRDSETEETS